MKKTSLFFLLMVLIVFSCTNSKNNDTGINTTNSANSDISTSEGQANFFAMVVPSGNQVIVTYSSDGKDTLYTYVTEKDTTINLSYTYKIKTIDTVWHKGTGTTPTNVPPMVNAGSSQTITLPNNSVTLTGTAVDADGSVATISWTKVSGGAATITNTDQLVTNVTGLVEGTYSFRLTVTDNLGASSFSNTTVVVNPGVIITPTLALEGYGVDAIGGPLTNVKVVTSQAQFFSSVGSNVYIKFGANVTITQTLTGSYSYLTIDGNGYNVTWSGINDDGISLENSHHVILKDIRVQNCTGDGINAVGTSNNIAVVNCSSTGNGDGNIDLAATEATGKAFTVQYCILADNKGSGNMLITTQNASVHHNLFVGGTLGSEVAERAERNPYAHSNYSPKGTTTSPNFDFRNNIIFAAPRYASGNGYGAVGNYVNNYYTSTKSCLINLCADNASCGTAYVSGNFNQATACGGTRVSTEYVIPTRNRVTTTDARTAALSILQNVGPKIKTAYETGRIKAIVVN